MNYKFITGEVLEIDKFSGWTDGMLLEEIYPESSFVSGNNPESMMMKPFIKDRKVYAKYTFEKREYPHPRSKEALINLAKYNGTLINKRYAEAFILIKGLSQ